MSRLKGTGVALATPLNKDLSMDFDSLNQLIEYTMEGNSDYLVVMGTTGESPVFSWSEKLRVLDFVTSRNNGRKPIVFGLGGNHTADLVAKSKDLEAYDLEAILSVSPYYSRPSQQGLIRHYTILADAFPRPIILYNVPSRTASNVDAETTLKLAAHENIIAMKEASGDMKQCHEIAKNKPSDFMLLSGDDGLTLEMIKQGAEGAISVVANILPLRFTQMVNHALQGHWEVAEKLDAQLKKAYELLIEEGNPSSLKIGLSVLNICASTVKPPLFEGSWPLKGQWEQFLDQLG